MPIVNGTITISFTSNYAGTHTITYTIVNGSPASGTITVTCGIGPCQANIPVTYTCPECEILTIEGTILADCSDDPQDAVPFGPRDFHLDLGCKTYRLTCIGATGCPPLVTGSICPPCPEFNNAVCAGTVPPSNTNGDIWGSYVLNGQTPTFDTSAASVLKGQVFDLCYTTDQLTTFNNYNNTIDGVYIVEENPDNCCWECETLTFTFNKALLTPNGPTGYIPGQSQLPTIYYTACDEKRECATGSGSVKCFAAKHWIFTDPVTPGANTVTLCLRKDSWKVYYAGASYYTVTPNPTLPCGAPPQYTCD